MPPARRGRRRRSRVLWIVLVLFLSSPGLVVGGGYLLASYRLSREEAAWAAAGWSMDAFAAQHPARPDNAAALRLDELTRPLGIVSRRDAPGGLSHGMSDDPALTALSKHLNAVLRTADDRARPARPPAVDALFARHARDIDALEAFLLTEGPIEWEEDVARCLKVPLPNLLGFRRIQELLLIRALDAADRGNAAGAARALEAAWRHSSSLDRRPELITQLIGLVALNMQDGVLRRLAHPPSGWRERLAARDLRTRLLAAYQGEAYGWRTFARGYNGFADLEDDKRKTGREAPADRLARFLTVPYLRLTFADTHARIRLQMLELQKGDPCTFDSEATERAMKTAVPRWNVVGRIALPTLFGAWASMRQAALHDELTVLVLEAREKRRATGSWIEDGVPSRTCLGVLWMPERQPDGRLRIAPNVELPDKKYAPWPFLVSGDEGPDAR